MNERYEHYSMNILYLHHRVLPHRAKSETDAINRVPTSTRKDAEPPIG